MSEQISEQLGGGARAHRVEHSRARVRAAQRSARGERP
jgi:hypothetical protein